MSKKAAERAMARWQTVRSPELQECVYCLGYVELAGRWKDVDGSTREDLHQKCGDRFTAEIVRIGATVVAVRPDQGHRPAWGVIEDIRVEVRRLGIGLDVRTRVTIRFGDDLLDYSPEQIVTVPAGRQPFADGAMESYWESDMAVDAEYRWWMADPNPNKSQQFQPKTHID